MQTLLVKYFPFFIFIHFIFCILTFISVLSYVDGVSLMSSGWTGFQPVLIKAVIFAAAIQVLPVFIYYKWSTKS